MIYKERYCTDEQLRQIKDLGLVMFDCSPDFRLTQQMAIDMFDEKGVYIEISVYGIQKPKFGYTIAINDTFLDEEEKFFDTRKEAISDAITCCCDYLLNLKQSLYNYALTHCADLVPYNDEHYDERLHELAMGYALSKLFPKNEMDDYMHSLCEEHDKTIEDINV